MGAADVVPGVSGGTMAFILGIYTQLIDAIRSFDHIWVKAIITLDVKTAISRPHFGLLVPLGIGILSALLFFTRAISLPALIIRHPEAVYSLFFGLIAGSIIALYKQMKDIHWQNYLNLGLGLLLGLIVFNLIPTQTPETGWFIFLTGALAVCAMILPGISGAFILLLLNKYSYIFHAIGHFQWQILLPFVSGAVMSLLLTSRVLSYLLHRYYNNSVFFIIGLLLASLSVIWPYQERHYVFINDQARLIDSTITLPVAINADLMIHSSLMLLGFVVVILINRDTGGRR